MMRLTFILLVFFNLLVYAWTQGYFGAGDDNHEPQRMAQQLHADKLRIISQSAAPAVKKEALACRVVNGLTSAEAAALKAAVGAGGGEAQILPMAEPNIYLVLIGELANAAAAEKKAAELGRFGVAEQTAVELDGGRFEIILGSFPAESAAREMLQGLVKRGIKSARIDSREQPAQKARVEARGPAAELLRQLPQLIAPYADATIGECSP